LGLSSFPDSQYSTQSRKERKGTQRKYFISSGYNLILLLSLTAGRWMKWNLTY